MKASGTKKFLIILFSLVLAVTAGLGVFFATNTSASAYGEEEEAQEIVYDDELLQTIADETGFDYEIVNFYAHVFGVSAEYIYDGLKLDRDGIVEEIKSVLTDYVSGGLSYKGEENIEDEDWFVAPDEAEGYAMAIGLSDTWTEYVASSNRPVSNETDIYWGNTNFTVGSFFRIPNEKWDYYGTTDSYNVPGDFAGNGAWPAGNFFKYSWVWLEEGDEYQFGIYSRRNYNQVYMGAMKAETFFEEKLKYETDSYVIGTNSGDTIHYNNIKGYWFAKDNSGTYRGQDPQQRTLAQYIQDYATDVDPTTPATTATSTKFMKWDNRTTGAGYNKITITGDAPSGVYYFRAFRPSNNGLYRFVTDNASAISECDRGHNYAYTWCYPHNGWSVNSDYCDYAVIVQRNSVSTPSVEIETGVNNAHTEKTVTYDSTAQSITINNDWGEGLMMCNVTYTDSSNTAYTLLSYAASVTDPLSSEITPSHVVLGDNVTAATAGNYVTYTYNNPNPNGENVTIKRGAVGRRNAEHIPLVLTATDKGTYTVKLTPFNKWSDGTSTAKTFTFKIVDRYLTQPALSADGTGVVSGNTKTVNDDGNLQYVNFYPVPQAYLDWDAYYEDGAGGYESSSSKGTRIDVDNWSDDGMLTLAATQGLQGKFKIVIKMKTPDNVKWTDGSTGDLVFFFSIEPRLLTVSPTILGTTGVNNTTRTKTLPFSGSYQTMNIMYVDGVKVTYDTDVQKTYVSAGNPDFTPKSVSLTQSQSLLALTVFDAGTYVVTLDLGEGYCWTDGGYGPREYTFIVTPKAVTAPVFYQISNTSGKDTTEIDESDPTNIKIKTEYVGDTVKVNGIEQTWTADVKFTNAYEQSISWYSPAGSQYNFNRGEWLNSTLTVTARNAGKYILEFICKPNYEWAAGSQVPRVELIINRKPVAIDPYIIMNPNEPAPQRSDGQYFDKDGKKITGQSNEIVQMTVDCDFNQHALYMFLGDKDAINAIYNSNAIKVNWDHATSEQHSFGVYNYDGDTQKDLRYTIDTTTGQAVIVAKSAGTYTIDLQPSSNYCWNNKGHTFEKRTFTFKLNAQPVTPLDWAFKMTNGQWEQVDPANYDKGTFSTGKTDEAFPYKGKDNYYEFKIGPVKGEGSYPSNDGYLANGKYDKSWYAFYVVYNEKIYFENQLSQIDAVAEVSADGFLYIKASLAGEYKVKVLLQNIDYCWKDSLDISDNGNENDDGKSSVTYKFTINKSAIAAPVIDQSRSNPGQAATVNYTDTKMSAMYYGDVKYMAIGIQIAQAYAGENGIVKYEILDESGELQNITSATITTFINYDTATNTYFLWFTATNAGTYKVRIYLDSPNHRWAGNAEDYTFTLYVPCAPVTGITVKHDVVDICTNAVGSGAVYVYDKMIYSEKDENIVFTRAGNGNLLNDTFKAQYKVEITGTYRSGEAMDWDYGLDDALSYITNSLTVKVHHAGTYIITVTPTANCVWNAGTDTKGSINIKLTVNPLEVGTPKILEDKGDVDNNQFIKTVDFTDDDANPNSITVVLATDLGGGGTLYHPAAYTVASWDGNTYEEWTGAANTNGIPERSGNNIIAKAKDVGSHDMFVRLSDTNNYTWKTNNDAVRYTLKIDRKSLAGPEGWLVEGYGGYGEEPDTDLTAYDKVRQARNNPNEVIEGVDRITAGRMYPATITFDGDRHYVYLVGTAVTSGWICTDATDSETPEHTGIMHLSVVTGTNGNTDYVDPEDNRLQNVKITAVKNNSGNTVAYEISAINADSYYITLKFTSDNYKWNDTGINNDVTAREYVLKIKPRTVDVPTFEGLESQTLVENSYTAEFTFDVTQKEINILGITELMSIEMGNLLRPATPDATGKLLMRTLGTLGYASAAEEDDYKVILSFKNYNNIQWASGDPTEDKIFRIKINSMEVTAPKIDATGLTNEYEKHIQFTGIAADVAKGVLTLKDISAINYYLEPASAAAADVDDYLWDYLGDGGIAYYVGNGYFSWFQLEYTVTSGNWEVDTTNKKLKTGAEIGVGRYTVTVKLLDSDNMVWKSTSSNADLQFSLVIDPMPVDIPLIKGTSDDGVVGLTKTVKYTGEAQKIELGNFWADNAANWNSDENLWMNIETLGTPWVEDYGDIDLTFVSYVQNHFPAGNTPGASNTSYNGWASNKTKFDIYNKGLLTFSAVDAGTYTIRYKLTDNAVWNDPTYKDQNYIDVKFVIEKNDFATPEIDSTSGGTVSGKNITYTYELDSSFNAVEYVMRLLNYNLADPVPANGAYMRLDKIVEDGTTVFEDGAAVSTGKVTYGVNGSDSTKYDLKATDAGAYEIKFKLTDFNNRCWEVGKDVETITFVFKINKLTLTTPELNKTYSLNNETIEGNNLTVEYDDKAHSMVVQFITEGGANGSVASLADTASHFMYYSTTASSDTAGALISSSATDALRALYYADTTVGSLTTNSLFDLFGAIKKDGTAFNNYSYATTANVNLQNIVVLTAFATGTYEFKVALKDTANMQWGDGTDEEKTFTLEISKKVHDTPSIPSDKSSQQYTGDWIDFTIYDIYNEFATKAEWDAYKASGTAGSGTKYEGYEVISYNGKGLSYDASDSTASDYSTQAANIAPLYNQVSWYEGNLILQFKQIGTYEIRVKILLPDEVSWRDNTDTEVILTVVVLPRDITAKFTFEALGTSVEEQKVNASLQKGSNAWPLSTEVTTTLTLSNIIEIGGAPDWSGLQIEITSTEGTFTVIPNSSVSWTVDNQAADGTWSITYKFTMPYNDADATPPMTSLARGTYTLTVTQLDDPYDTPGDSNYKIVESTSTQTYTITPDPAPFDDTKIVWQYENSNYPGTWNNASAGGDRENRLHLWYLTGGGYWTVRMMVEGYANLSDALDDGKVVISRVAGDATAQNVRTAHYYYTVYLKSADDDLWYFPETAYTLYYTIDPALYNLSDIKWVYPEVYEDEDGNEQPYSYIYEEGTYYGVHVENLPTGLSVISDPNRQTNAGEYTTAVRFASSSINYVTPVMGDTSTYEGTFEWTCKWSITQQHIYINWAGGSYDSDGSVLTYNPVVDSHQEKFAYRYYQLANDADTGCTVQTIDDREVYADPSGNEYMLGRYKIRHMDDGSTKVYIEVGSVSGGTSSVFYVEAYLRASYVNNYTFDFGSEGEVAPDFTENGNFKEFTFTDGTKIYNHITINGTINASGKYEYTGEAQNAEVVVDLDTTGGAIDRGIVEIQPYYYRQLLDDDGNVVTVGGHPAYNENSPLSFVPYDIGKYVVVAKLIIRSGSTTYTLSQDYYSYEIVKQVLKAEHFEWHYIHENTDGEVVDATYDPLTGQWKNVNTGVVVDIIYDGNVHDIRLVYNNPNSSGIVTPVAWKDYSHTNASNRLGTVYDDWDAMYTFNFDAERYEFPSGLPYANEVQSEDEDGLPEYDLEGNPVMIYYWSVPWHIEKQALDLTLLDWDYEGDYEFAMVGDTYKYYSAELKNLPEYLKDKVVYVTSIQGDTTNRVSNSLYNAGLYYTVATINTDADDEDCLIDFDNYEIVGITFTTGIVKDINWEIKTQVIDVPSRQPEFDWTNFDGNYHSLFAVLGIQSDWEAYYTIKYYYQASATAEKELRWDSTEATADSSKYLMYSAYDAGIYTLVFDIKAALNTINTNSFTNVAWNVASNGASFTVEAQTVELKVDKANLQVVNWKDNYESSTVILGGTGYGSKFISYKFYRDNTGTVEATLDEVLESTGGETFYIHAYIDDELYGTSVSLSYITSDLEYHKFITRKLSDIENAIPAGPKPYIAGYTDPDGRYHAYTPAQLAEFAAGTAVPTVIYTGGKFTFNINNWSQYETLVTFWNGSVADLKQSEVNDYSVTLVLKTTDNVYYYWKNADGSEDRKSVVLKFKIEYRTIPLPDLSDEDKLTLTYSSDIYDILKILMGADGEVDEWLSNYGEYFEITGNRIGRDAGTYELYLTIKDEHSVAVRWTDAEWIVGEKTEYAGTYKIVWNIDILKIKIPTLVSTFPEYDGDVHYVYEIFDKSSFTEDEWTEYLTLLQQYLTIVGGQGQNAGTYQTVITLPNKNLEWVQADGTVVTSWSQEVTVGDIKYTLTVNNSTLTINWAVQKAKIDFSKAVWGYVVVDEEGNTHYEKYTGSFKYTVQNGQPYIHRVQLVILDDGTYSKEELAYLNEMLVNCVSYTTSTKVGTVTSKYAGNGAYKVSENPYVTSFSFDSTRFDANNYEIDPPAEGNLSWSIEKRTFDAYSTAGWTFDGSIHEFMVVLGYGEDWANYFDIISVEYKAESETEYSAYNGKNLEIVEFSLYKGYYTGSYRVVFKLKDSVKDNVEWSYDSTVTVEFNCEKYVLDIKEWDEFDGSKAPSIKDINDFSEEELEIFNRLFEYVIYEDGDSTMTNVDFDDVQEGVAYIIELRVKEEYKDYVVLTGKFFFDFGNFNYTDPLRWIPLPEITLSGVEGFTAGTTIEFEYNGSKQTVEIYNPTSTLRPQGVYTITSSDKATLRTYGVMLSADDSYFVYVMGGDESLTQSAAGEYSVVIRLHSKVNLSWYDPTIYEVKRNAEGNDELYYIGGAKVTDVDGADKLAELYDRSARTLTFTIKLKGYEPIDMDGIAGGYEFVYNGSEQDIALSDQLINSEDSLTLKDWFDKLKEDYGDAIKIEGNKATDVPEEGKTYTVKISLRDANSSYWYLTLDATDPATFLGITYTWNGTKFVDDEGNEFNGGNYEYKDGVIIFVDYEFTFSWTITAKYITAPVLAEDIYYTGSEINVTDYDITNYFSDDMKITEGGKGTAVGPYEATVEITSRNYIWIRYIEDEGGEGEGSEGGEGSEEPNYEIITDKSVKFEWQIKPAQLNLTGVVWKITGGGETYTFIWQDGEDGEDGAWVAQNGYPTYTRANGKAVVYTAELDGLPEVLKGHVVYTTNKSKKAHAGSSAGKYTTTVEITGMENFGDFEAPNWLKADFVWQINQRELDKPAYEQGTLDFNDEVRDLLSLLNVTRGSDWNEYYTIDIWYSEDVWAEEVKYEGYGGDAYLIYGTGTYRIEVKLVEGINGKYTNVVWKA